MAVPPPGVTQGTHPLTRLFNLSIVKGTFHSKWKVARITPLYKDGAQDSRDNYRPISLLSVPSKVMEKHGATSFCELSRT